MVVGHQPRSDNQQDDRAARSSALRVTPFIALVLGVTLLAAGVLVTTTALAQEDQHQRTLERDAAQVSASFSAYFERARSLDLLLAQDRAFVPGPDGQIDLDAANESLAFLEVLYPDAIGEACIIDDTGRELARVSEGVRAPEDDLSLDEAENPFFAPTLSLQPREVYQAPPYLSPDTGRWVISNSTWIPFTGNRRLIVHFEVSLDSFSPYVTTTASSTHVAVVNRGSGEVFLQDRTPLPSAESTGGFQVTDWSRDLASASVGGAATIEGHQAAFRLIDRTAGNANDWYVVEWSTASSTVFPAWLGMAAVVIGSALLLGALLMLRRQQITLRRAARLDHLTGLANRRALEEALEEAVEEAVNSDEPVAVLVLDLDGFKQVNDVLGHDKGDLVLQEIARRLFANVFEYDTPARLGGDEFAVVLRHLKHDDDVAAVAHRLRDALTRPIEIDGISRFIGASIGAARPPEHGMTGADLLRNADAAMYRAKRDREGVRVYDAGTLAGASALGRAAELLAAIDNSELHLVFQPEQSLTTGEIVGIEALARWTRPGHDDVPPVEFIALAEETGLIRSLTSLTLRLALDAARDWRARGIDLPVSVNLSGRVATDRSLPGEVRMLLEERGLNADALVLEITETAVIADRDAAIDVLHQLRADGVRIELDDFGSGYSSFRTLHDLPLDGVKIDRSLVAQNSDSESRLLAATIENVQRLGLAVIAEGIEDEQTLDLVRSLGCDSAQGFHIARPMTTDALHQLLGLVRDDEVEAARST